MFLFLLSIYCQVGDRTLLFELFRIVSERADTKFKFLSLSPNIYLSATADTASATSMIKSNSVRAVDNSERTGSVRQKGTQFISGKVLCFDNQILYFTRGSRVKSIALEEITIFILIITFLDSFSDCRTFLHSRKIASTTIMGRRST